MERLFAVVAAAIALTACAGPAHYRPTLGARPLQACEHVIYRVADAGDPPALRCASVVGAWE